MTCCVSLPSAVIPVCYYLKREDEMLHDGSEWLPQRQHVRHSHATHRIFGHHHLREGLKFINMEQRVRDSRASLETYTVIMINSTGGGELHHHRVPQEGEKSVQKVRTRLLKKHTHKYNMNQHQIQKINVRRGKTTIHHN